MFYRSQNNWIYGDLHCAMHSFQNAGEGRNGAPRYVDAHGGKRMAKAMEIGIYFASILSSLRSRSWSSSSMNKNKEQERKMKERWGRRGKGDPQCCVQHWSSWEDVQGTGATMQALWRYLFIGKFSTSVYCSSFKSVIMCSPFFLTFLEVSWKALRVLLWFFNASISLACSLSPLLCLCCILCHPHGPEQVNWFQKGAAIPPYAPLSPLPGKCDSDLPAWMLIDAWGKAMHFLPAQALQGQKPTQSIPFTVLMLNNIWLWRSLRKMHERKVSFLINSYGYFCAWNLEKKDLLPFRITKNMYKFLSI